MKLTPLQIRTLEKLEKRPDCSYSLSCSLNTLNALEKRNLVTSYRGVGCIWSPRTAIKWKLTTSGQQFLNQLRR